MVILHLTDDEAERVVQALRRSAHLLSMASRRPDMGWTVEESGLQSLLAHKIGSGPRFYNDGDVS